MCVTMDSHGYHVGPVHRIYFDNNTIARYNGFGRAQNAGARMTFGAGILLVKLRVPISETICLSIPPLLIAATDPAVP